MAQRRFRLLKIEARVPAEGCDRPNRYHYSSNYCAILLRRVPSLLNGFIIAGTSGKRTKMFGVRTLRIRNIL